MKNLNRKSIISTQNEEGFKYHVFKGRLEKGSIIAKNTHPIEYVEYFKNKLIERNILKDMKTYWVLKDSINVGQLMALNLHRGELVKENDLNDDIIVSHSDANELQYKLPDMGLAVSDSDIVKKYFKDSLKISGVFSVEINKSFINTHNGDDFRPDERFVLEIMQKQGIISENVRHGKTTLKECDIVDESTGIQYEVIFENKNTLNKSKNDERIFDPEWFIIQLVNNSHIHPSKALLSKIYKKEYSSSYKKHLIILSVGSYDSLKAMVDRLYDALVSDSEIKNHFENIYFLTYDFINSNLHFLCPKPLRDEYLDCSYNEIGLVNMKSCDYKAIDDDERYLLICKDIFNGREALYYATGKELHKWVTELRIME